jgi:hypothetical protein
MRWNDQDKWIWSERQVHEPLIDVATFEQVQALRRVRGESMQRAPPPTPRPYVLRGLLYCGACTRRMQGSWNNNALYYRCLYLTQYAARNKIGHPRAVYLRESEILPELDGWLAEKFGPASLRQTLRELTEAADDPIPANALAEQARLELAACDAKLRQHRAALEAGADPAIVTGWIADVQAQRAAAEARQHLAPHRRRVSAEEIERVIAALGDMVTVLADADGAKKATTYANLRLKLTYEPSQSLVRVESARSLIRTCT